MLHPLLDWLTHLKCPEESTITIHDNEPEPVVVGEQSAEGLGVELVVAEVEGGVDGFERLEVNVNFLLLALVGDNSTAVDNLEEENK